LEKWTYRRNGAVEGPVATDQLAALYEAGEITDQTLVRSTIAGGGWRRYEDVVQRRHLGLMRRFPRAITKLWPWFAIGTPLVGGLVDVFLVQSYGHDYIATNSWIGHGPIIINLSALTLWLVLIWRELRRSDRGYGFGEMVIWLVAAPVYQAVSWWATALVSMSISLGFGFDMPQCDSDVVQAQVRAQFERNVAKRGDAKSAPIGLTGAAMGERSDQNVRCEAGRCIASLYSPLQGRG
jgi:hypothetical protein